MFTTELFDILIVALIEKIKSQEPDLAEVEKRLEGPPPLSP